MINKKSRLEVFVMLDNPKIVTKENDTCCANFNL